MLTGIDPVLTGELLAHLDAMGHSDAVVVADGHFPAARLARRLVVLPGLGTPEVLRALRSVLPADDSPTLDLMSAANEEQVEVHQDLVATARVGAEEIRYLSRKEFYDVAAEAYLIVRTTEQRTYANAIWRKGVVSGEGV